MTAGSDRDARTARLIHARRSNAQHKQQQAMDAVRSLEDAGTPITVTAVARAARVSTWFIYNNVTVRAAVDTSTRRQAAMTPKRPRERLADDRTLEGLRVDLAGARDEIRALRNERAQLRRRLERIIGDQIGQISNTDLAARVGELTEQNLALILQLSSSTAKLSCMSADAAALRDDLAGARAGLRRMMQKCPKCL